MVVVIVMAMVEVEAGGGGGSSGSHPTQIRMRAVNPRSPGPHFRSELSFLLSRPADVPLDAGTNDYLFKGKTPSPPIEKWEADYIAFAQRLMSHYNHSITKLLLVCGPMTDYQCPAVERAAAALSATGMVAEYVDASLPKSPSHLSGCAGHPNATEASMVVTRIAPAVQKLMGWS